MSEKLNFLKRYGVDVETGIQNTMDEETYNEILDDFFNEIPNNINRLGNFKVQGDMANYAILVHSLKSNARTLGFGAFGEICYKHEMESKAGNTSFINSDFNNLVTSAQNVYAIIRAYKAL